MYAKFILALFIIALSYNGIAKPKNENLIYIENGKVQVGILVEVGGTIVSLRYKGGENILEADSTLWNEPKADRPNINAEPIWKAYKGHTVWLGPQSDWWTKQNLYPELKKTKSTWPPDPWLIYGSYKIVKQTASSIIIESPKSPVSGVSILKNISISKMGKVTLIVTLKNTGNEPASWDIWMNTRLNGMNKGYVPINDSTNVRKDTGPSTSSVPTDKTNGYFSFTPKLPSKETSIIYSKAFIHPSKPFISGFTKNHLLMIKFKKHKKSSIHPNQSLVEIFNMLSFDSKENLLELEYHSPYKTLKPGQSMKAWQTWEVYPYNGDDVKEKHIEFLDRLVK